MDKFSLENLTYKDRYCINKARKVNASPEFAVLEQRYWFHRSNVYIYISSF